MRILGWIFLPFVMIFKNWQQRSVWVNIIGSLFAVSVLSFYILLLLVSLSGGTLLSSIPSDLRGMGGGGCEDNYKPKWCPVEATNTAIANTAIANKTSIPTATPVPPTATPIPPTATPVPPTATPVPPTATTQSQASLNKTAAAKLVNSAAKTAAAKLP